MIKIVYKDEHIVIVHKPSGLLVHRSAIDKYETKFLIQLLQEQLGQAVFLVHRLDKPTSGLMVLALDKQSARLLSDLFATRQIAKEYTAMLRGYVDNQTIDYPLTEILDKMTDKKANQDKKAQSATSIVEVLAKVELPVEVGRYKSARFSLVKLIPQTGRKHQLRRHMAHIRHPILGDTTHGDGKQNRFAREHLNLHRLALVATRLSFVHPLSQENLDFSVKEDEELQTAWHVFT